MMTGILNRLFRRGALLSATLVVMATAVPSAHAEERRCSVLVPISTSWTQVICPGSLNERTVTKTGTHYVAVPAVCPASGTNGGGGTPPIVIYGGGGGSGGGQSGGGGGGGGGGGTVTSLPDPDEKCIIPSRPNDPPQCPIN